MRMLLKSKVKLNLISQLVCTQPCTIEGHSPLLITKFVIVCHLSIATRHPPSTRRQLRSITSLLESPPRAARTACRRSRAKVPEGKRKDVMMTYRKGKKKTLSDLNNYKKNRQNPHAKCARPRLSEIENTMEAQSSI
jgi:hypothetical protein